MEEMKKKKLKQKWTRKKKNRWRNLKLCRNGKQSKLKKINKSQ
jgi:hypothetical protein